MISITTELNLTIIIRNLSAEDLARLSLEALDACVDKLARANRPAAAAIMQKARADLTLDVQSAFD